MSNEPPETTRHTAGDLAHSIAIAAAGSIPVVGAGAAELLDWFWKAPTEKRRDETIKLLGAALEELRRRGASLEELQKNDGFVDTMRRAAGIAMENHQTEKRDALRNGLVNSGLPHAPDDSKQQMFLQLVDIFTVWHLKLLEFFADPTLYLKNHGKPLPPGGISAPVRGIEIAFPELNDQQDFCDQLWSELRQRGLVASQAPPGIVTFSSPGHGTQTTSLGSEFLRFITTPPPPTPATDGLKGT